MGEEVGGSVTDLHSNGFRKFETEEERGIRMGRRGHLKSSFRARFPGSDDVPWRKTGRFGGNDL